MKELAYEFRYALAHDFSEAANLLNKHPELIDHPVYGDSESALHFYAVENQFDIVSWLIDHGANPNGVKDNESPLQVAAQLGHQDVCRALLKTGVNPNLTDNLGETALHKASGNGHLEIIEHLLESGADPTIPGVCGELPVDQALPRKKDQVKALFDRYNSTRSTKASKTDDT